MLPESSSSDSWSPPRTVDEVATAQVLQFRPRTSIEPFLSRRQLAEHLDMSERWVDYRRHDGMPSYQFGNRRKFKLSEVLPWLQHWQEEHGDAA